MVYGHPYDVPLDGADKYHGKVASGYDAKREKDEKWVIEQKIIEEMLDDLPDEATLLDIPCGTGRFFPYYIRRGFFVTGADKSDSMLEEALKKVPENSRIVLGQADVRKLDAPDNACDAAVMCRLTRWLSPNDCVKALKELQRVATKKIIFTARVRNHPHARSYELIRSALDGWRIHRDEAGADLDYRIIELRPC
jgi:ubiquinone/menaquinone biosynthesis C-methylase UbiE